MHTPSQRRTEEIAEQPPARRSVVALLVFSLLALYALGRMGLTAGAISNLGAVAGDAEFLRSLGRGALVSLGYAAVMVALSWIVASLVRSRRSSGALAMSADTLAVQLFAGAMLSVPLLVMLMNLGNLDMWFGLLFVAGLSTVPFAIWQLKRGYDSVPPELAHAARIDGCSPAQAFSRVTLPAIRRPLIVTALFCFMMSWAVNVIAPLLFPHLRGGAPGVNDGAATLAAGSLLASFPLVIAFVGLCVYAAPASPAEAESRGVPD